jgi:hypothetical protein
MEVGAYLQQASLVAIMIVVGFGMGLSVSGLSK